MKTTSTSLFRPRDGALLDLDSLRALATGPDRHLRAWLHSLAPGAAGVILEGLEPQGEASSGGPPGTVRPDAAAPGLTVSPGVAILVDRGGAPVLLRVEEPLSAPWPTAAGAAVRGVLVLVPRVEPARSGGELVVARDEATVELGFVRPDQPETTPRLALASAVGNGRDWMTDLARQWTPEHPAIRYLLKRLEAIDQLVWRADPEGAVWDRQVLGRNWVRYQTVAASALQSARMILETHSTTTVERVRLLGALRRQLQGSVERGATELLQLVGTPEGAGPYRAIFDDGAAR